MAANEAPDIDALWEFSDPPVSERRFRDALARAGGNGRLELLTQVARALGLQKRFAEAHELLDEVERELPGASARVRVRYLLERGRAFNSGGDKPRARPLFLEAFAAGEAAGEEGLAVDAAHMVAIVEAGTPSALEWNERGLAMARRSKDAKAVALIAAMLNNQAWEHHGAGRYEEALRWFREAEAAWTARGRVKQIQIAKWSVARCLRSLGRHDEALAIQRALEAEHARAGTTDPYVFEEIGENLKALGKPAEAEAYAARARAAR